MKEQENIEDLFLQALIKNDGLKTPSRDFTSRVMANIPSGKVVVKESSRFIGRNLTLLIFLLIGIINLIVIYFLWPYLSVWIPENSLLTMIIDNASAILGYYAHRIFNQSVTISLLIIIGIGIFVLVGRDEMMDSWNKISKRPSI